MKLRTLARAFRPLAFVAVLMLLAAHESGWHTWSWLDKLEWQSYDLRQRWLAPQAPDPRIVIVDVDERSLQEPALGGEGRWPWPRKRLAELLGKLIDEHQVSLVAMDFIFSEPDRSSGLPLLDDLAQHALQGDRTFRTVLEQLRPGLEYDQLFAQQIARVPVVLGAAFHSQADASPNPWPSPIDPALAQGSAVHSFAGLAAPLPVLREAAAALGHLNPVRDTDGVTRRIPMLVEHQQQLYPSLSLATAAVLSQADAVRGVASDYAWQGAKVEALEVGGLLAPVDKRLAALVPFRGSERSFAYVSAADVLRDRAPTGLLRNRIVFLGTSAAGLTDYVSTPLGVTMPGVELHAHMLSGMLDERVPQQPAYTEGAGLLSVLVLGLLMVLACLWLRPLALMALSLALMSAVVGLNAWAWLSWHLVLPLVGPLLCVLALYLVQVSHGYWVESRSRRQVAQMFSTYVPPGVVEVMARDPEAYSMAPTEKELTAMFVNIREFSSIAERLNPSELAEWINIYLSTVSRVICVDHQGTLDKYMGDAVMAFWGAPVADAQHAEHAVAAAMQIRYEIEQLNYQYRRRGWPAIAVSIGINTGRMRVGDMGSSIRRAYTVMGDAVNIAAQLQTLTRDYGCDVLMGKDTAQALSAWACRSVDTVRFIGRRQSIELFEPVGKQTQLTPQMQDELVLWQQVLEHCRAEQWAPALEGLQTLLEQNPACYLYALYKRRVTAFRDEPGTLRWDRSYHLPAPQIEHLLRD